MEASVLHAPSLRRKPPPMTEPMTLPKSDFLRVLTERGFIHQCSDLAALDEAAATGMITAYVGYDCTAASLHIGNLISAMMLRWLQKTGHRPITLMGGGTTRVGDPSGKDETRRLLTVEQIEANKDSIKGVFSRLLDYGDTGNGAIMVDNAEWLTRLNYIDMLRDIGRHFSINRMLTMDSVRLRLEREQELSFIEFNYMLMQATDFLELTRRHDCVLQMGGSDQWGNIVNGLELGRRMGTRQLYALTTPLLTTASGAKMGKTASGAVWLNADQFSPYDYWQFWRNTEDGDVGRFLKLFTELPLDEIARLEALPGAEINEAKKVLATEATALLHGRAAAEHAAGAAKAAFEEGRTSQDLPTIEAAAAEGLHEALIRAGFAASKGEARRLAKGGGVRVNDVQTDDVDQPLSGFAVSAEGVVKLAAGKKKIVLVRPV